MCLFREVPKGFIERRFYLKSVPHAGVLGQHGVLMISAKSVEHGTLPFGIYLSLFFPLIRNEGLPRVVSAFLLFYSLSQLFVYLGHCTVYSGRTYRTPLLFAGHHSQECSRCIFYFLEFQVLQPFPLPFLPFPYLSNTNCLSFSSSDMSGS